ncbi:hypothetical protein RclHR1_14800005 [Rhizophagus clarus]|uniref:RING-type domain-containing protein n=1 Tax=Rhizophagus clarus TaxID=94130 RepID=A0A2Z6QDN2_9GLOM|nr:hypothetical protein RclHR1_14800005 [Rhizophagus clarus]
MKCSQCKCDKLSNEFLSTTVTGRCDHISSYCLSCLVKNLDLTDTTNKIVRKCPECPEKLSTEELRLLSLTWDKALLNVDVNNIGKSKMTQNTNAVYGNKYSYIKRKKLNVDEDKQKLIYDGVELQDYKIEPGSHIQLIIVRYSITRAESINGFTFDLNWGYPASGRDYLDGSCLLYKGDVFFRKYDYATQFYPSFPYMKHSGNLMDNKNKRGHQHIEAKLDQLPPDVTQLYFVLSTFKSPTIGHFRNPSFKMINVTQPDKPLCTVLYIKSWARYVADYSVG